MKFSSDGFSAVVVLILVVVIGAAAIVGWKIFNTKPVNELDSAQTIELRFDDFKDACMQTKQTGYPGTFVPVTHTEQPKFGGGSCFRFTEQNGQFEALDLELTFPNAKSKMLTAGFYNGGCSDLKDEVYPVDDVVNGVSKTTLDIDPAKFRGNTANPNGWVVLAAFDKAKTDKPIACTSLPF